LQYLRYFSCGVCEGQKIRVTQFNNSKFVTLKRPPAVTDYCCFSELKLKTGLTVFCVMNTAHLRTDYSPKRLWIPLTEIGVSSSFMHNITKRTDRRVYFSNATWTSYFTSSHRTSFWHGRISHDTAHIICAYKR
jgi:hypothetical protein